MSSPERDAPRTSKPTGQQQHLYLIFDDWELGYSIRKINLANAAGAKQQPRLPPPFIRLEATRGSPEFFAAVGTKILATHPRPYDFTNALVPGGILPMVDVRSRGVNFAPGGLDPVNPIFLPVDDLLFALDMATFKMLSMKQLSPPRLEYENWDQISEWSWVNLPLPPFQRKDVTSYAVGSDQQTILFSTTAATFSFDLQHHEWKKLIDWPLPFSGHANYVHSLDVFVGLPKDEDDSGRLCFCKCLGDDKHVWLSNEDLLTNEPDEDHVGSTLVYLGQKRFCLVECINNGDDNAVDMYIDKYEELSEAGKWEEIDQMEGEGCHLHTRCCLTTFSLRYDMNGDLSAANTAVQCYKVPLEASRNVNPVAFWL